MAVTGAEIKIGVDILSQIFKSFKGVLETRKEKNILSKIYKELLLGKQADIDKVEAMLQQVEKLGSSSSDLVKAKRIFKNAKDAATKLAAGKAKAMPAAKRTAAKKPPINKVVMRHAPKQVSSKKLVAKISAAKK